MSTKVPAPPIVKEPVSEYAPEIVRVVPEFGASSPLPVKVLAPAKVMLAVVTSLPPLLKFIAPFVPKRLALSIWTVPPMTLTPPVKVFVPVSTSVPAPVFCRTPAPAMMPA